MTNPAFATQSEYYKTICHHTPGNQVTLNFANVQSYTGHLGTPHSGSTFDTDGVCQEPSVTPVLSVSPTISPCDEEYKGEVVDQDCVTPIPTETPEATPSVEPTGIPGVPAPSQPSDGKGEPTGDGLSDGKSIPAGPPNTGFSPYDGSQVGWK